MKLSRKESEDITIDMSPMIDMVFLLLIFFIVSAATIVVEPVKVEIPDVSYAEVPEDQAGRFKISVNAQGEMFAGIDATKVDEDQLRAILTAEADVNPNLKIVIRSDLNTKYEFNEKIMMLCAEAGLNDMIFVAFRR